MAAPSPKASKRRPHNVQAKAEREGFRDRLHQALKTSGITPSPTKLTRLLLEQAPGTIINAQSVRKWLIGASLPTQDKLRILAGMLNTSAEWLRYGEQSRSDATLALLATFETMDAYWQLLAIEVLKSIKNFSKDFPPFSTLPPPSDS